VSVGIPLINRASALHIDRSIGETFASYYTSLSEKMDIVEQKISRSQFDGQNRCAGNTFVDVNKQFANN